MCGINEMVFDPFNENLKRTENRLKLCLIICLSIYGEIIMLSCTPKYECIYVSVCIFLIKKQKVSRSLTRTFNKMEIVDEQC